MSSPGFICNQIFRTMHIPLLFMSLSALAEITLKPVRYIPEDVIFPSLSPVHGKQCLMHPAEVYWFQSSLEEHVELERSIESSRSNSENLTNLMDLELDQNQLTGKIAKSTFTPYSAKVPWKTGTLEVLFSKLFPRYGHYCGPSWSSGRESGSLIWDKAPIDSLDFCCFQHDMGFDSHEQADLHMADSIFLNCLEKIPLEGRKAGDHPVSELNRKLYIFVLKRVLIPYRKFLLQNVDVVTKKMFTKAEISGNDRSGN